MHKVLLRFNDLNDKGHQYYEGDIFPREGFTVSKGRLKELSSKKNKRGKILIEEINVDNIDDAAKQAEYELKKEGSSKSDEKESNEDSKKEGE